MEFRKRDKYLLPDLLYLIHWSQRNESDESDDTKENLWPKRFPNESWILGPDNRIDFISKHI